MRQTREAITQNLAERLCWEAARRDDARIARRLDRKQGIDGIYRLDEGAVLEEFFHFLEDVGVLERMAQVRGMAMERAMVLQAQAKLAGATRLDMLVVDQGCRDGSDLWWLDPRGGHLNRRDCQPNPSNAVVVRKWNRRDDSPGGKPVFLTNAAVTQPLPSFDDDDDWSLIENGCSKEAKQPWDLGHPPQKNARAVRGHVVFTLRMFALATA